MPVNINIPSVRFQDYRDGIPGDSYGIGPVINAAKVRYFAFHHSVTQQTAKSDSDWKRECDVIANPHIPLYGGVGYRFIICSDGTVAYVGDLSRGGAAVVGNNDIIISACLVGDFTKELPTAIQVNAAYYLQKFFREQMPQYPLISSVDSIIGHKDAEALLHLPGAMATACPGTNWRTGGDTLRDRILSNRWQGYPNPQPVGVIPVPPTDPCAGVKKELEEAKKKITGLEQQVVNQKNQFKQKLIELGNSL